MRNQNLVGEKWHKQMFASTTWLRQMTEERENEVLSHIPISGSFTLRPPRLFLPHCSCRLIVATSFCVHYTTSGGLRCESSETAEFGKQLQVWLEAEAQPISLRHSRTCTTPCPSHLLYAWGHAKPLPMNRSLGEPDSRVLKADIFSSSQFDASFASFLLFWA